MKNKGVIARAATVETLEFLLMNAIHCFMNSQDTYVMTNGGLIWTNHGQRVTRRCILNMPEWYMVNFDGLAAAEITGICSDYIEEAKEVREESQSV